MSASRFVALILSLSLYVHAASHAAPALLVQNNQPFPIDMPWLLRGIKVPANAPAQQVGDDAVVMINVPANGSAKPLEQVVAPGSFAATAVVKPADNGIALNDGQLSWGIVLRTIERAPATTQEAQQTRKYVDGEFAPLPLKFEKSTDAGPLFETWSANASDKGVKLAVILDVYRSGFVDIHHTVTNESAAQKKVYCAVVCRWKQNGAASRSVDYDNHIAPLADGGATPFRGGSEGRHMFVLRGVDWINTAFERGGSILMLNDFAPSFTVHHEKTEKMPPRWVGANTAQLGEEAFVRGDELFCVTEIARPNIRSYASRLDSNVLPDKDQPLSWTRRLICTTEKITDERADQTFVTYTSYNEQSKSGETITLSFGVPHVKFGTAYFPYSTLGENFEQYHLPGQSQNTYWPLSADTVTHWKLFADDIKRDLRIAKSMGFESIRLHHLEMLAPLPKEGQGGQDEYLDFFFGELKHLGLTALLDVKLPKQRIAELVKKYRPQIDGVEIDNEVLIFGINDGDVHYWKDVYAAVKAVAPDLPVHLTGHTNTGAFERLIKLGVPFDRVGCHAYQDSLDAIPSGRDYALAVADEASEIGKPPLITEWNWRFLTRMTEEDRAKVYPPIFENVLKTRCVPVFYQFQFQESLAMASRTLRGIRHYELLNLSRRPRPEALEFIKLIDNYADPSSPQQAIKILGGGRQDCVYQSVNAGESIGVRFVNRSDKKISVTASAEGPQGLELSILGQTQFELAPKQGAAVDLAAKLPPDAPPGFYHAFVRFDGGSGVVSYAWVEIHKEGAPAFDKQKGVHPQVAYSRDALDFDLNRDLAVVYDKEASGWEVESAWLIYQTLEAASGRPVKIFQWEDRPEELRTKGNLIVCHIPQSRRSASSKPVVGAKSWVLRNAANKDHGDWLVVGGDDEEALNIAAIDFVLRYWKHAKDSACRRIPLTDKPMPKGADPGALP